MVNKALILITSIFIILPGCILAEDKIEMKITRIKGNKELPKLLYVVPWKDIKQSKHEERKLELHSLFGDLFDPVIPRQSTQINN